MTFPDMLRPIHENSHYRFSCVHVWESQLWFGQQKQNEQSYQHKLVTLRDTMAFLDSMIQLLARKRLTMVFRGLDWTLHQPEKSANQRAIQEPHLCHPLRAHHYEKHPRRHEESLLGGVCHLQISQSSTLLQNVQQVQGNTLITVW